MHSLQPPALQTKAAAKARAALLRPEPGGPVKSQACVISCDWFVESDAADTASCKIEITCSWSIKLSKTESALTIF